MVDPKLSMRNEHFLSEMMKSALNHVNIRVRYYILRMYILFLN